MAHATTAAPATAPQKEGLSRREFLNIAWLASLGIFFVELGAIGFFFAMPRFKAGQFGGDFPIGTVADLPGPNDPPRDVPDGKFWLSNTGNGVMALYKVCTHLGCLFNWSTQENKFICPCHGSQFQKNGTYIQGPAGRSLDRFIVKIEDGGKVVAQTPPDGGPAPIPAQGQIVVATGSKITGVSH
ncbi:MAG: hypothetical protein EXR62_01130 [Chloroflexi bacterium]|nr:hypothetical protein [Chloroflexota bacterium]